MVRKRSRKYESDDSDNDSDLDFELNPNQGPAPKKYSLRERRAPMLTDFYYGLDDDDADGLKQSSDDDDFEVEADVESTRTYFEPDPEVQNPEGGLIDFEDIIRADIVVNKNKIDYDNIIQKTEIKLTETKKPGRKPKNRPSQENETDQSEESAPTHTCEPDIQALAYLEHQDEQESKEDIPEVDFAQQGLPNGDIPIEQLLENGDSSKLDNETDPLAMRNASNVEKDTLNPPLLTSPPEDNLEDTEKNPGGESTGIEDDDDVIVLGEVKQPVIVLDD